MRCIFHLFYKLLQFMGLMFYGSTPNETPKDISVLKKKWRQQQVHLFSSGFAT